MKRDKKKYNILIVEDNPGDFLLIQDYLEEQIQHPVITNVKNYKAAKDALLNTNEWYDVILLDLSLPDKSGKELITEITALNAFVPIIVLTGYSDVDFSIQSLSLGVADYLVKDEINALSLYKSIVYNIERKKTVLELSDSEKKYSDLFQLSPQPMYVYALDDLQFLDVNEAAKAAYGYNEEEFLSKKITDLFVDNSDTVTSLFGNKEQKSEFILYGSHLHKRKLGTVIQVEMRGCHISYKNTKAEVIIANDVTQISKHIDTVQEQNKRLREIAWIQSHLVRAPLARMMSLIELIKSHVITESEKIELMDYLIDSSYELDKLIRDISNKAFILTKDVEEPKDYFF